MCVLTYGLINFESSAGPEDLLAINLLDPKIREAAICCKTEQPAKPSQPYAQAFRCIERLSQTQQCQRTPLYTAGIEQSALYSQVLSVR